ncbi:MAG: hypothetical protein DMD81_14965 [Candidatus Rokuibacteriota bacterium]|nr:MAG: hypothetical protein DMD81_14965 [Candidatus Rokubacteria bacterium]
MTTRSAPVAAATGWPSVLLPSLVTVLGLGVPMLAFDLGQRVLATNDETRFPILARDILANGHWLLPEIGGVPHLNKPPGCAWLIAIVSWPFGAVTQWSAGLSALVAAIVLLVATVWIGQRLFGRDVATVGGLIAVTTYGVFLHARIPRSTARGEASFCSTRSSRSRSGSRGHPDSFRSRSSSSTASSIPAGPGVVACSPFPASRSWSRPWRRGGFWPGARAARSSSTTF